MTVKHYGEPWTVRDGCFIEDAGKNFITAETSFEEAERIVACVNICNGIPSERLIENLKTCPNNIKRIEELDQELSRVYAQRDDWKRKAEHPQSAWSAFIDAANAQVIINQQQAAEIETLKGRLETMAAKMYGSEW